MMSGEPVSVVVDASVVLKWQLNDEEHVPQAIALRDAFFLAGAIKVIAPDLLIHEIINGIVTATRKKRIASDTAVEAINNLIAMGIELKEIQPLRVLHLSLLYNLAAYDAAYLALAEAESSTLWTGDRPFYQAVKNELPWVKWIGNYTSKESVRDPRE